VLFLLLADGKAFGSHRDDDTVEEDEEVVLAIEIDFSTVSFIVLGIVGNGL
jgi:hypothetical protein